MPGSVNCPHCGHVLFAIELPIGSSVHAHDPSPPLSDPTQRRFLEA